MEVTARADALTLGLRRYFTGEACRYGHVAERRVSDHGCVECSRVKAASPQERARRREYMREHQRMFRRSRPDLVKASDQKRDKDKRAADKRAARERCPDLHRAALRRSFQKHKVKRVAESMVWRSKNKERHAQHMRAAKAKRRAAVGKFASRDIERMLCEQNFECAACRADVRSRYHVDHVMPLARGGTNWPDNLQLLCPSCNKSKGAKTMGEWLAWKSEMCKPYRPG